MSREDEPQSVRVWVVVLGIVTVKGVGDAGECT